MRFRLFGLSLSLTFCAWTLVAFAAEPEDADLKYFRDLAETRNYTLGRPVSPQLTPDGKTAIFLRSGPRDPTLRLYDFDLTTKKERELLTPEQLLGGGGEKLSAEEKARRERQRQSLKGFTTFKLSKDAKRMLVTLSGKLYLVARETLKVSELPGHGWIDPAFSPDGNFVAAAGTDRELHVIDLATVTEKAVTSGATPTLSYGTAEFVAQEEMSRYEGYWWSPDSQQLLCQETDESKVEVRYVADPLHPEAPPTKFFYPHAGSANAIVGLFLVPRAGGSRLPVTWDRVAFPYLTTVRWAKNAPLCLLVQDREQTDERLLAVDLKSGATHELLRETDSAWINLDDNFSGSSGQRRPPLWLEDGSHFLWTTERRGRWQVELHDATGALVRELTPTTFTFHGLIGVENDGRAMYIRGSDDARETQVWKFALEAGGPRSALTTNKGLNDAMFFAESGQLVVSENGFEGSYASTVVDAATGKVNATLPSTGEKLPFLATTELIRTTGARAFDAAITRPRAFSKEQHYPVILSVYAGPTSKRVMADARGYLPDQWMADQGYIVVRIDGRGTPWQGRDWERSIKGNFIDVALEDQVAGLTALGKTYPELDLTRVGITGWSFGGYFTAMATIRRPDIFRAGVAGAPVITWENYDSFYTERYLGLPQAQPEAYKVSNVTTYAAQLTRPLLLIHGLTDDNVYFQHTLQLADALYLAGKPYELLPMLGTHMVSEPLVKLRQQMRIIEFFDREVKGK